MKFISKWVEAIYVTVVPIFLICELIFPTKLSNLKVMWNKYLTIAGALITCLFVWSKLFDKLSLIEHIGLTHLFGSKINITTTLFFSATTDRGCPDACSLLNNVISKEHGTGSIMMGSNSRNCGHIRSYLNGESHEFLFQVKPRYNNKNNKLQFRKIIKITQVCKYTTLNNCWSLMELLKDNLITHEGFSQDEYYMASLLFSKDTPFYRFTVKDLENKSGKILYNMKMPIKNGHISIERSRNSPSRMIIASTHLKYIKKVLNKYFIELGNS